MAPRRTPDAEFFLFNRAKDWECQSCLVSPVRFLVAPEELPMRSSFCLVEKVLGVLPREFVANTESVGGDILYYATEYQPTCG